MSDYVGHTHSALFTGHGWQRWLWRLLFCRGQWHLWDEVLSGVHDAHYLVCDACGVTFDTQAEAVT